MFARPDLAVGESGALFLMNLTDWMALDPDLIAIRSKGSIYRPLREIPAGLKPVVRWVDTLGPALLVAGFGMYRLRLRRLRRKRRLAEYSTR